MWSLYQKRGEKEEFLPPLIFSNGKSQEDIVKEIIEEINKGTKIIFLDGVCGTGKSSIALHIAKELGRASIVVPVKALQKQYESDYLDKKYLKKGDRKFKIKVIFGRKNYTCPFLEENPWILDKKEKNSSIYNFNNFSNKNEGDISCDNQILPCKIEIKEKNFDQIKKYLKENNRIKDERFPNIKNVRRLSIAQICPYWSPIVPANMELETLDDAETTEYPGLKGIKYKIYSRKPGCRYYNQFESYHNCDAIIFNSEKYKIENLMNRKPETDIEIIDECDEFLDSLSNQESINLNRLNSNLGFLYTNDPQTSREINEIIMIVGRLLRGNYKGDEILKLEKTEMDALLKYFSVEKIMESVQCDEENYCYHCEEVARTFNCLHDETYVSFYREGRDLFVRLVTINLEKRFKEISSKNKAIVLMSGTLHSEKILKDIFKINDFKIIKAETQMPGEIIEVKTGHEVNCSYESFKSGKVSREKYLFALNKCIEQAKKPILVHVIAFKDLPSEREVREYNLGMMTQEQLMANYSNSEKEIERFRNKETDILYTTKCGRGADFPGDMCNSIILTRFPYPNVSSLFWKVLKQTHSQYYHNFYSDKSRREFLQKIYRGLRSKDDKIYLMSPDSRVFGVFKKNE